jgi:hypothetical protein
VRFRLGLIIALVAGCHSTVSLKLSETQSDLAVNENADLSAEPEDLSIPEGDLFGNPDTACTPQVTSCVGLCGPIFDTCLGKNVHCGACEDGGVCDLFTHTCGVPKTDCTSLGAECGVVKNSCGTRLTCPSPLPYCASGKECNAQTNKCVDCANVTCEDHGYECGTAWLGCGSIGETVECGVCDNGKICNPFYNVCDPQCTPASATQLCDDAKTLRGVECGFISDGCGGRVRCPDCPAGFGCAAQGEQNRCQPLEKPTECIAANRNCGDLVSVCGGKVHCGDCIPPDVCNPNGVCGPPCSPKTCTELGNPACGLVDDGCMGTKKCNDCPMPVTDYVCLADHTCCKKKKASDFAAGQCGTQLDDGCGGKVNVPCPSGTCSETAPGVIGMCCTNTNPTCGNTCNTSVTDSCSGAVTQCNCPSTHYCNGTPGTCVPRKTCADYTTRMAGQPCSNGNSFDDGSGTGTLITCPCLAGYCITGTAPNGTVVQGATRGTCCTDTGACAAGQCDVTVANTCINDPAFQHVCGTSCGSRSACNTSTDMCVTCGSFGANGQAGQPCSNGGAFNIGNGTLLSCPCTGGRLCVNGTTVVTGSATGTCCQNTAVCPAGSSTQCNYTGGTPNNTCTGVPITPPCGATCTATQACSGPNGTCLTNNCSNIGVRMSLPNPTVVRGGADGNPCNDNANFYQNAAGGGFFSCPCTQFPNSMCSPDNTGEGQCICTPSTCSQNGSCSQNGQSNGCGGVKSCACVSPAVCFNNSCCTPKNTCNNPPTGVPAPNPGMGTASCNYGDGCGGSVGKQCCPTSNQQTGLPIEAAAMTCVPHAGANPAYGDCICNPTHKCTDPGIMDGDNDGCGHVLDCPN